MSSIYLYLHNEEPKMNRSLNASSFFARILQSVYLSEDGWEGFIVNESCKGRSIERRKAMEQLNFRFRFHFRFSSMSYVLRRALYRTPL